MDELTMLVQLAGGENEAVRRLRTAGLRGAKELARAKVDVVCSKGGLSTAASRRLVRAAQDLLVPARGRKMRSLRSGLTGLASSSSSGATSGAKQRSSSKKAATATQTKPRSTTSNVGGAGPRARTTGPAAGASQGVSRAESSTLAGEAPREERSSISFWRFG